MEFFCIDYLISGVVDPEALEADHFHKADLPSFSVNMAIQMKQGKVLFRSITELFLLLRFLLKILKTKLEPNRRKGSRNCWV
jgi:hypothetical protein